MPHIGLTTRIASTTSPSRSTASIAQFSELLGHHLEIDVIELKENTKDGKPLIKKLPGARKSPTITLKRGKNASMALWEWHYKHVQGNDHGGPQDRLHRPLRLPER